MYANYLRPSIVFALACFSVQLHAEEWGYLTGKFIWDGELPKLEPLKATKDFKCCGKEIPNESLVVDPETKGIANVLIYLRHRSEHKIHPDLIKPAKKRVFMKIEKCRFVPHILPLQLSQTIVFDNKDACAHNANIQPIGDVGLGPLVPAFGELEYPPSKAQRIPVPVTCNIHPWMRSYVLPLEHPYVAVTAKDGSFEIKNLPAGELEFQLWHEKTRYLLAKEEWERGRVKVTIKNEETNDLGTVKVSSELFKEKE